MKHSINKRSLGMAWAWLLGVFLIVVGICFFEKPKDKEMSENVRTNREVAMSCTTDMATQFHIHPFLKIVVNGSEEIIPANVGIEGNVCMHPIHTHDATGKIHIESPEKRDFTLSDFFAVWGKTFSKDEILGFRADVGHEITMTVNGALSEEFENLVLRDGDQIIISYQTKK